MSCGVGPRRGSDLEWLWLWHRLEATAPIRPLAWESPCAAGAALKEAKGQKKKKVKPGQSPYYIIPFYKALLPFLSCFMCALVYCFSATSKLLAWGGQRPCEFCSLVDSVLRTVSGTQWKLNNYLWVKNE